MADGVEEATDVLLDEKEESSPLTYEETEFNGDNPEKSEKRKLLESWLNKIMRIKISDGRTLIGSFLCTDQDRNIILGSCQEFVGSSDEKEEPRILGLAMVPGKHIVCIEVDVE
ncbi:N-alpha-acetyltransferase 38, NatC auxiliary subunit-like [Stylophora pistillata]|uniref:N-alpha-acetyltransferase 38, NatC auxiliary subunit n=1 Tax=Stylophora pistillata TaxID=50429 RepID=A0A2B4S645_STYPI|nr:N-alpha-acetyltransferase 38, NatC auxiliary subunit-like [Stylophora pistillata]PFX26154.1 N-alpha-acetyltransferase 38, NatC auxiliary subunit [Stylophora pistillata]